MLVFKERSVKMKSKKAIYRWTIYILGFILLAMGIVLNTKCGLGVSPIISVAYTFSLILGTKIGNTTLVLYSVFVLFEMILHAIRKCPKKVFLFDILQIAVSVVFTRFINLFSDFIPQLDVIYKNQWQGSMPFRIFVLIIAIILTGLGAAMSLNMRLVPNPGDGIVQAIADTFKKPVGFTKNCWDILMVSISTILTITLYTRIADTRLNAFLAVISIGTILAVIGVGRVIAVFNHFTYDKMMKKSGISKK